MDQRTEVNEFLRTRRDRIMPDQAGIIGGGRRRVPGLRREEVAMLAGVSAEYYARIERGDLAGVSPEILDAVARALRFDEAETDHLEALARAAGPERPRNRRRTAEPSVRPSLQLFLDSVTVPVWVRDRRMNFIASNQLARAVYAPVLDDPVNQGNIARFWFLNPASHNFFVDWEQGADDTVATIRTYAGQNPHDKQLTDLIGELVTRSDAFRRRWSAHNVRHHRTGVKRLHHPVVGDLELQYEAMDLPADPEWFMFAYTAAPGSPTDERLRLLGRPGPHTPAGVWSPASSLIHRRLLRLGCTGSTRKEHDWLQSGCAG
ncbi:helix-turn-helix domain-containing protein [Arthrobacter sp. NA-172]|uniref:helix-turn-helix domain-containing protein n=1 Tax=Arthrobacter sp. NA-172 TaxID=3367524 RepID=UPI0037551225